MRSLELMGCSPVSEIQVPVFTMSVYAGKPTPVESDIEEFVDLNQFLIDHPAATYFIRVNGHSFSSDGISDNDILIVDSVIEPQDGSFVIVSVNDELTIKIYRKIEGAEYLESWNGQFLPVRIEPYLEFVILGVVTKIIHTL